MNEPILTVDHVSLVVDRRLILDGVCLEVEHGSVVGIIGPNGAGKSTLLKCMNRICTGYTGDIRINSRSTRRSSQKRLARTISYVPQAGADVPPPFTVREFAHISRYSHHAAWHAIETAERTLVDCALSATGMLSMAERPLASLSGGERQKAFIAAALAQETDILLLDEPTSFLDYRHQTEVARIICDLSRGHGRTVVSVTHDINLAMRTADYVLAMKSGQSAWFGPAHEALNSDLLESVFETPFRFLPDPERGVPLLMACGKTP